jgi:ABC-2 type transport system permease protein
VSKGAEFLLALPIVVGFALWYRHGINIRILMFPVGMFLQLILSFGCALILAPLTVIANDVQRVIRILLRMGFYLTPVLYSLNNVAVGKEWLLRVAELNPMAGILSLYRIGFWEQDTLPWHAYVAATVFSFATLFVGLAVFKRLEGTVLKEI